MQGSDDVDGVDEPGGGGAWEIEEVPESDSSAGVPAETSLQRGALPFAGGRLKQPKRDAGEDVYVAVGKGGSSMDALVWVLNQLKFFSSSGFVYLVHVFPEVHHIPTPLGMLPKKQVSPQQVETHMLQERSKRKELLRKYINLCYSSKVEVDTILIESDLVAKAILELIPVVRIRKLIMGTSKSNLRMIRRGGGKVGQVVRDVPEYCEVKIVCEGQEVRAAVDEGAPSPSPQHVKEEDGGGGSQSRNEERKGGTASCGSGGAWEIEKVPESDSSAGDAVLTETSVQRCLTFAGGRLKQSKRDTGLDVYVAVGKGGSSMDALVWALNQLKSFSSDFVYLIHVFSEVHHIPTPLGMLPKKQVSPEQVETHMLQVRSKRKELMEKYINLCYSSKVEVDTILIESDLVAKAILELIPVLRIRKLIMGTSKSNPLACMLQT